MYVNTFIPKKISRATKLANLSIRLGWAKVVSKRDDKYIGKLLCEELKNLGPTFIKIGQFLSTRNDIFGRDFTDELKDLQDNVYPMPKDDVKFYLDKLKDSFSYLNEEPLACASIGQVHYGRLPNNQEVAIKLKRRYIDETVKSDFEMLLAIINFVKAFSTHRQIRELEVSLREYYNLLLEEINYIQEVDNMKKFKYQFRNTPWIRVPTPYLILCTNDVIVMEYVPSIKINNIELIKQNNLDPKKISEKLLEVFFEQIMEYAFVHIDPHPGNVGIMPSGKIVFYDYGMFMKFDNDMKQNLKSVFLAVYERDVDEVCKLLLNLNIIILDEGKRAYFRRFVASFVDYLDTLNINEFKLNYIDKIDQNDSQFLIASRFILLLRSVALIEGVCKELNPDFNYRDIFDSIFNDSFVDLNFIERRGNRDLIRFSKAPDEIVSSQITIDLLESDLDVIKTKLSKSISTQKYLLSSITVLLCFEAESVEMKVALFTAVMMIFLAKQ